MLLERVRTMAARRLVAQQLQQLVAQASAKSPTSLRWFAASVEPSLLAPTQTSCQHVSYLKDYKREIEDHAWFCCQTAEKAVKQRHVCTSQRQSVMLALVCCFIPLESLPSPPSLGRAPPILLLLHEGTPPQSSSERYTSFLATYVLTTFPSIIGGRMPKLLLVTDGTLCAAAAASVVAHAVSGLRCGRRS